MVVASLGAPSTVVLPIGTLGLTALIGGTVLRGMALGTLLLSIILTIVIVSVCFAVPRSFFTELVINRGWTQQVQMVAFFWGVIYATFCYRDTVGRLRRLPSILEFCASRDIIERRRIREIVLMLQSALASGNTLARQIAEGLRKFEASASVTEVERFLTSERLTRMAILGRPRKLTQFLIWACPLLGLLGTINGILISAASVLAHADRKPEAFAHDILRTAAEGVTVTFDPLLVGVFLGMVLWVFASVLQEKEMRLTEASTIYVSESLLTRLSLDLAKDSHRSN